MRFALNVIVDTIYPKILISAIFAIIVGKKKK